MREREERVEPESLFQREPERGSLQRREERERGEKERNTNERNV